VGAALEHEHRQVEGQRVEDRREAGGGGDGARQIPGIARVGVAEPVVADAGPLEDEVHPVAHVGRAEHEARPLRERAELHRRQARRVERLERARAGARVPGLHPPLQDRRRAQVALREPADRHGDVAIPDVERHGRGERPGEARGEERRHDAPARDPGERVDAVEQPDLVEAPQRPQVEQRRAEAAPRQAERRPRPLARGAVAGAARLAGRPCPVGGFVVGCPHGGAPDVARLGGNWNRRGAPSGWT